MIPRYSFPHGYSVSRLIKGGWHLAGGHGAIDSEQAVKDMARFVEAGITTFDCADIYTGVEALIGSFRRAYPSLAKQVQVHTKFVPDLSELKTLDRRYVEAIIDRSLTRLGTECLDLVQFHWWDFALPRYVETALELDRLQRAGKIARLGVTNFSTLHVEELLAAGVPVVAHQLQYSFVDDRPRATMVACCRNHGIALLCYGTVGGGFLSEHWLGRPEPSAALPNRSLIKYKLIIDDFGGWALFQELLTVLAGIARKRGSDIASVATRAVLDLPQVAAAVVGATSAAHLPAHARTDMLTLAQQVPGISFKTSGPGQTEFEMRGMTSTGGESPTVGFYLDDAVLTPAAMAQNGKTVIDPSLFDLSRVEVLRGPQGTLYGAGSMGGTIKLVTNQPNPQAFAANVEGIGSGTTGGGFNHTENVMLNVPLMQDVVALRLVGTDKRIDGWTDRVVLNPFPIEVNNSTARGNVAAIPAGAQIPRSNWEDLRGGRASLLAQPNDRLSATLGYMHQEITQDSRTRSMVLR